MPNLDAIRPQPNYNHNFVPPPRKRNRKWKWLLLVLIVLIVAGWSGTKLLSRTNQIFTSKGNIFTRVGNLIISPDKQLTGEDNGQINVLLLGAGGQGHDGPLLTDTMIVANINVQTHEVVLISIPRDFIVQLPQAGFRKLNAAYALAEEKQKGSGGEAILAQAEKITGFRIPYYGFIDFRGFVKAVDDIGGLDITIDRTFTDDSFPNDYPFDTKGFLAPVTFKKGGEHMTGQRALIFARSRHSGDNNEGSDFARSERQKKILIAMKDKVLKLNITNLGTINNLLSDFTQNFRTNLEPFELKHLADLMKQEPSTDIYSLSLEPQGDLICAGLIDDYTARAYVVQPCEGRTLTDIHEFLINTPLLAKLKKEGAVVEIQNSTGKPAALQPFKQLVNLGVDVRFVPFRGKVPYTQTIFYNNSHATKPHTLDYLNNNYTFITSDINYPGSAANFVLILGKDAL